MDPRLFWDSTFREIGLFLDGARLARMDAHNDSVRTAWYAASLVWLPRLPVLEKLMVKDEEPRETTVEEYVGMWRAFFDRIPPNEVH